ncbi:MAG: hypothetical protein SFW62_01945 [Alphaproteobacteria bacterium]|nr:hypothetical protein [Alphaproteobacteria bacterium]
MSKSIQKPAYLSQAATEIMERRAGADSLHANLLQLAAGDFGEPWDDITIELASFFILRERKAAGLKSVELTLFEIELSRSMALAKVWGALREFETTIVPFENPVFQEASMVTAFIDERQMSLLTEFAEYGLDLDSRDAANNTIRYRIASASVRIRQMTQPPTRPASTLRPSGPICGFAVGPRRAPRLQH